MSEISALPASKLAAKKLRTSTPLQRNGVLASLEQKLGSEQKKVLEANTRDLAALTPEANSAFRDRLTLTPARLEAMRESLRQVAALPDPLNEIVESKTLANGLKIRRVRSPLGLIFMIFESRPNVAVEAFSLALKSGNALILRGGKESRHTVEVFYSLMKEALLEHGLPSEALTGIANPDRKLMLELLQQKKWIDVVVPRGGDALIEFVTEHSKIPLIKNDRGMCHVYVDSTADLAQAEIIIENAKTQRPGVCNAMETLLVHQDIARTFIPALYRRLSHGPFPVEWFLCPKSMEILRDHQRVRAITPTSFDEEYLDYKMNCRVVENVEQALEHIEEHGSRHSEAILTQDEKTARYFQDAVDAAAVYWNASTRFTDGFELGLGGELGISTQKLHVRGPVGLKELTSVRWVMDGTGQIRK